MSRASTLVFVSLAGEKQIVCYQQNEATGALTQLSRIDTEGEPGFLTANRNGTRLFAAYRSTGDLASYQVDPRTGQLTLTSLVPAGADPAYVALDRSESALLSAYYRAGKVGVHSLGANGELSQTRVSWYETNLKAHAILTDSKNEWALVPHTGPNAVYVFRFNRDQATLLPSAPPLTYTGTLTGPRHLQFHPELNRVYFDYEQGNAVAVFEFDPEIGQIRHLQTVSTLPTGFSERNSCSDLEITPNGRFLYAANRGHDSIAGFEIDSKTGKLTRVAITPTEAVPRSMTLTANGNWLIAAGQDSDHLQTYQLNSDTGALTPTQRLPCGKRPWAILAVTPREQ